MSRRPLVSVTALTVGDYLLWNWSLNSNHDVIALVAGLTLPPLALVCLWLLVIALARLLAGAARRPVSQTRPRRTRPKRAKRRTRGAPRSPAHVASASAEPAAAQSRERRAPSRKIAA